MSWLDRFLRRAPAPMPVPRVRAPKGATRPLGYVTPGRPMLPAWNADNAIRKAYLGNVFVYRCAQVRAHSLAGLPIRVGPDPEHPNEFNPDAPLVQILTRNPSVGWRQLAAWSLVQLDITGRVGWEIERDRGGQPLMVWPLASTNLDPIVAPRGSDHWFDGFEYRAPGPDNNLVRLSADEVFYAWRPAAFDWSEPESLIQAQRLNVDVARMLDEYNRAFLQNDARPAAVVVTQAFSDPEEKAAFEDEWAGRYGGPRNSGKVTFVEAEGDEYEGPVDTSGYLSIHNLGLTQKDAQALELYQEELRAITVGFGVPLSMLGDASKRTFANAEQEERNFWRATMIPVVREVEEYINRSLAPLLGSDRLWFDLSKVEVLRPKLRVELPKVRDFLGTAVTVNEAREFMDLPRVDDPAADELPGMALLGQPLDAPQDPEEPPPGGDDPDQPTGDDDVDEEVASLQAQIDELLKAEAERAAAPPVQLRALPDPEPTPAPAPAADPAEDEEAQQRARRRRLWAQADARMRVMEGEWRVELAAHFAQQLDATLDRLGADDSSRGGRRGRQLLRDMHAVSAEELRAIDVSRVFDPVFWRQRLYDVVRRLLRATWALAGAAASGEYEQPFDVDDPSVQTFILARANQLSGQVTDTTYRRVQRAMVDGTLAGEDIPRIAERIQAVFTDASEHRATVIARTEVISASNAATEASARQLGEDLVGGLEWLATPDQRARDAHREADGEIVPVGSRFSVGNPPYPMRFPGDPAAPPELTVNCRCSVSLVPPEDMPIRADERLVDRDLAERVLGLVADGVVRPQHIERVLEVAA